MDILCRLTSVLTFRVLTVKSFRKQHVACVTHFLLRYQLAHVLYRVFRKVGDLARAHLIRANQA